MGPALALEFAGVEWEVGAGPGSKGTGNLWAEWLEMKPNAVWGYLPNLEVPGVDKKIGTELAILNYLGRKYPSLGGETDEDFIISQNLMHQSDELYMKLTKNCPTIMAKDKPADEFKKFWDGDDANTHSNAQGLKVYLSQFEAYMKGDDKFTSSGTTVGEIKLFATLYLVTLIDPKISFGAKVAAFMKKFNEDPKVTSVLGDKYKDAAQYFIAPP